ncbi:hypothetical protein Moror_14589 [Moniliophthora roreri MCA 2997]|uniref:Uncharacterized protein n=2 Tax=Moniliophthora roreri TaxID=221103 RepID=V2XHS6_MONRO|nr:hypothetical protein Moror_14589 [Moniliophthora roreri MCA 2997]
MTSDALHTPPTIYDFILQELKEHQEKSEIPYIRNICSAAIQIYDSLEKCQTYDKDATKPLAERAYELVYLLACTISHNADSVSGRPGLPADERHVFLCRHLQREGDELLQVLTQIKVFIERLSNRYTIMIWLTTRSSNSREIYAFMARLYKALESFKPPDETVIRECVAMLATVHAIRRSFPPEEETEPWNVRVYMRGLISSLAT